jgi:hypothetical protein
MADSVVVKNAQVMNANDSYILRWPHDNSVLGRPYTLICHILDGGTDDGTYTVSARPRGSSVTPVAIPYQSLYLNGAVGTGALVSTGITTTSLIAIEADGLEIVLVRAGGTTGSSTLTMSVSQMA